GQGSPAAQYDLAQDYFWGRGTERDAAKALKYYRAAAKGADVRAQLEAGLFFHYGIATDRDPESARLWLGKAAHQGFSEGQYYFAVLSLLPSQSSDKQDALQLLDTSAQHGYSPAQLASGEFYFFSTDNNDAKAKTYFQMASNQGRSTATFLLAQISDPECRKVDGRVSRIESMARSGNGDAQATMGSLCELGIGKKRDYKEAIRWYQMAAAHGSSDAQLALGEYYSMGIEGVGYNPETAATLLRKAAESGNSRAQVLLAMILFEGVGVPENRKESREWLEKAVKKKNQAAMCMLSSRYRDGIGGKSDAKRAHQLLEEAAQTGDALTQERLANSTIRIHFGEEDKKANKWLKSAADQGYLPAMRSLVDRSVIGMVTKQDCPNPAALLSKVAAEGDIDARMELARGYRFGRSGIERDKAKAIKLFKECADQGNCEAQNALGDIYSSSLDGEPNLDEACVWYRKAAAQGDTDAKERIEDCLKEKKEKEAEKAEKDAD
ncbi:MAG: sel1 repeat family protein, partial [Cyanobacteria bacterium]|nr:sel1 repeat family protein [Cyanobacteriota bacterium]